MFNAMYDVFSTILKRTLFSHLLKIQKKQTQQNFLQWQSKINFKKEYLNYFKNKQNNQNDNIVSGNISEKLPNHKVHWPPQILAIFFVNKSVSFFFIKICILFTFLSIFLSNGFFLPFFHLFRRFKTLRI